MMSRALFDVIGVGTNSVDTVLNVPRVPEPGGAWSKVLVADRRIRMGGQTATCLATCAGLGLRAAYAGAFGNDEAALRMREELGDRGIDLQFAVTRAAANHYAVILVEESSGERIVLWGRDAALSLAADEIPRGAIHASRVLHIDDVDPDAAIQAAQIAREARVPVTSDLDRVNDRTEELVRAVSVPVFAAPVPDALTGERDPERALRKLRKTHGGLLCVTLGEQGAAALEGDRFVHEPALRVRAVDTTGAGDVFRGGLIYALLNGWPVARMLRFANAAAAISCTRAGALDSVPTLQEVERLLDPLAAGG